MQENDKYSKDLFGPHWFYSVHFVLLTPLWSIWSTLISFGLLWFYSVHFHLILAIWSTLVIFGPFYTLWFFSPLWSYSVHYVYSSPIQTIWILFGPLWSYFVHFGPIWSYSVLFVPIQSIMSTLVLIYPFFLILSVRTYVNIKLANLLTKHNLLVIGQIQDVFNTSRNKDLSSSVKAIQVCPRIK